MHFGDNLLILFDQGFEVIGVILLLSVLVDGFGSSIKIMEEDLDLCL